MNVIAKVVVKHALGMAGAAFVATVVIDIVKLAKEATK